MRVEEKKIKGDKDEEKEEEMRSSWKPKGKNVLGKEIGKAVW